MKGKGFAPLLQTGQPAFMCDRLTESHLTTLDYNVFVRAEREDGYSKPIHRIPGIFSNNKAKNHVILHDLNM